MYLAALYLCCVLRQSNSKRFGGIKKPKKNIMSAGIFRRGLIFGFFAMERIRENDTCENLPRMHVCGAGAHLHCMNNESTIVQNPRRYLVAHARKIYERV